MLDASIGAEAPDTPQVNQPPTQVVHKWEITATYTGPETSHPVPPWLLYVYLLAGPLRPLVYPPLTRYRSPSTCSLHPQGTTAPHTCASLCHACGAAASALQQPWLNGSHCNHCHTHPPPTPSSSSHTRPRSPSRSGTTPSSQNRHRGRNPSSVLSYATAPQAPTADEHAAASSSNRSWRPDDFSPSRTLSSSPSPTPSPSRRSASPRGIKRPRKNRARCKTHWDDELFTRKIRNTAYTTAWFESRSAHRRKWPPRPIRELALALALGRGQADDPQALAVGTLHVHTHPEGVQLWMWAPVPAPARPGETRPTAVTRRENFMMEWRAVGRGVRHPCRGLRADYVLNVLEDGTPSWVRRESAQTYAAERRKSRRMMSDDDAA
ncbi:hypothetical protein C8Q79DRAFT_354528 [Trametes meyenii]|nr:hypothetical protein C8Q79DRAFT_354528 [Trametes meyenii]